MLFSVQYFGRKAEHLCGRLRAIPILSAQDAANGLRMQSRPGSNLGKVSTKQRIKCWSIMLQEIFQHYRICFENVLNRYKHT